MKHHDMMHVVSGGHLFQAIEQVLTVYRARAKMLLLAWVKNGEHVGQDNAWHRTIPGINTCKHHCMSLESIAYCTAPAASELRHSHCATFFNGHFGQNCQYDLDGKFRGLTLLCQNHLHPFTNRNCWQMVQGKICSSKPTFAVSTASTKAEWVELLQTCTWHLEIKKTTLMFRSAISCM